MNENSYMICKEDTCKSNFRNEYENCVQECEKKTNDLRLYQDRYFWWKRYITFFKMINISIILGWYVEVAWTHLEQWKFFET